MAGIPHCEPLNELHDERELTRLELVGLACEIAAVAQHAQSTLLPQGHSRRADSVRQECHELLRSADRVLSRDARHDELSTPELHEAVNSFRQLQRRLATLRGEPDATTETMLGWLRKPRLTGRRTTWRFTGDTRPLNRA